jgi:ethanolamine utilization protein EutA
MDRRVIMGETVILVGLDFGTTTSNAVVATAELVRNAVTGKTELSQVRERFRSDMVFTPLAGDQIDVAKAEAYLDSWLAAGGVQGEEVFGGGALLTGLTAQQANASALVGLIRRRLGDVLIASADDPCLESWLAFLGNCAGLSRAQPERDFINVDIGGGTTNLALGRDGQVQRTGCLFVGARHVQVVPGTYQILRLSSYARTLFDQLGIRKDAGDVLTDAELEAVIGFYTRLVEAAVNGDSGAVVDPAGLLHVQVPFRLGAGAAEPIVALSGGVAELIYAHLAGRPWPPTTHYGDLGIDLARRLLGSERLAKHLRTHVPDGCGRATVYGLLRHNTEISGSTLFLPRPDILPLGDLPVLGAVSSVTTDTDLDELINRVARRPRGGCLSVTLPGADGAQVRAFAHRLARMLQACFFPAHHPLVLLVRQNVGKALGHYLTDWGKYHLNLIVLDELPVRDAHYVQIGRMRQQVVPITFHGFF